MRPRMSVARCCCDTPGPIILTSVWGNWEPGGINFGLGVGTPVPANIPCSFGRFANNSNSTTVFRYLRFLGATIPQGSTITSATINVNAIAHNNLNLVDADSYGLGTGGTSGNARCDIFCEDNDNATTLTTAAQADALPRTTATVGTYSHAYGQYNAGNTVTLPSVTALVQEVVNRPGWVSNNSIQFLFDEDGTSSFNNTGGGNSYGILATVNDSIPGPPSAAYLSPTLTVSFT